MSNNIAECVEAAMLIERAQASAIIDWTNGRVIASSGTAIDGPGIAALVYAKVTVMGAMEAVDPIEDILITLDSQYHLIRLSPSYPSILIYLVLDRESSNLAVARSQLETTAETLVIDDIESSPTDPDVSDLAEESPDRSFHAM